MKLFTIAVSGYTDAEQIAGTEMAFEDTISLASASGATLALRHAAAAGDGKAILLILHGMAEHSARYRRFASFMAACGVHVYAHDHRGHGLTTAPDCVHGMFATRNGARLVLEDVASVRDFAAQQHPGLPVILFGHSLGGVIAMATAQAFPGKCDGVAAWNAQLNPGLAGRIGVLLLKSERFFKGSDVPSLFGPKFSFDTWAKSVPDARTPFDWLSRDALEVQAYIDDPLCYMPASVSMWLDVMRLIYRVRGVRALSRLPTSLPVHLVGGGNDPATDRGSAVRWLAARMTALGMTGIRLEIFSDMRHETLNDIGREEAMKTFAAWLDGVVQHTAGPPADA